MKLCPFNIGNRRPSHARRAVRKKPNEAYAPLSASEYFTQAAQVELPERGLDARVYFTPSESSRGSVMVCTHGAGYSGLSFACFAREVKAITRGECGVLAIDARGHGESVYLHTLHVYPLGSSAVTNSQLLPLKTGKTSATGDGEADLSTAALTADLVAVVQKVFPDPSVAPSLVVRAFIYTVGLDKRLNQLLAGRAQHGRICRRQFILYTTCREIFYYRCSCPRRRGRYT